MAIAHIQGKMQPLSDRVHAHSKLLTFMEISMSYTCFSGTELLVHTIRGNLMPTSPHSSKQWAYSFGLWLLYPNLPNRIFGRATEKPSCARCTNNPWEQLHWSWSLVLIVKEICVQSDWVYVLLNSWENAESTSCQQSWCHHFTFKSQLIHPSEHSLFSTYMCWEAQGEGKLHHSLP